MTLAHNYLDAAVGSMRLANNYLMAAVGSMGMANHTMELTPINHSMMIFAIPILHDTISRYLKVV